MPYCYVDDMSIVALLFCMCVRVRESMGTQLTWCIVFTETVQCTLGILERGTIMLLPMVFRCDLDR